MIFNQFRGLDIYTILIRIVLSLLIGGIIGLERGRKGHPAGFKTYMLVCLGSTMVMMTNQFIFNQFEGAGDVSRLGAQVISGIGFLGAGTIMVTRQHQVKGLTTAAGLWTAACVGLGIGIGFYEGALLVGIAIFLIMTIFNKIDNFLCSRVPFLKLYVNLNTEEGIACVMSYFKEKKYDVCDVQIFKEKEFTHTSATLVVTLTLPKGTDHKQVMEQMARIKEINYLKELQ